MRSATGKNLHRTNTTVSWPGQFRVALRLWVFPRKRLQVPAFSPLKDRLQAPPCGFHEGLCRRIRILFGRNFFGIGLGGFFSIGYRDYSKIKLKSPFLVAACPRQGGVSRFDAPHPPAATIPSLVAAGPREGGSCGRHDGSKRGLSMEVERGRDAELALFSLRQKRLRENANKRQGCKGGKLAEVCHFLPLSAISRPPKSMKTAG